MGADSHADADPETPMELYLRKRAEYETALTLQDAESPADDATVLVLVKHRSLERDGLAWRALPSRGIPNESYRDERVIARVLRELADEIEAGCHFMLVRYKDA